jgi:hypothetical protein
MFLPIYVFIYSKKIVVSVTLKLHGCDIGHTEDAQLKTTLLNHTLHTKQPRSAEGIDERRANTHTLRCVVLSANGLSAEKGN